MLSLSKGRFHLLLLVKIFSCRLRVAENLGRQFLNAGKFTFRPQELVKLDPDAVIVKISGKIEYVAFDGNLFLSRNRRSYADVRHGDQFIFRPVFKKHFGGVNAVSRNQHAVGKFMLIVGVPIFIPS